MLMAGVSLPPLAEGGGDPPARLLFILAHNLPPLPALPSEEGRKRIPRPPVEPPLQGLVHALGAALTIPACHAQPPGS